ncbi:MAG TPA: hypothetical protein VGJ73_23245 [Verrucomicrobiae bacterium]|jgi:hypothetical protein
MKSLYIFKLARLAGCLTLLSWAPAALAAIDPLTVQDPPLVPGIQTYAFDFSGGDGVQAAGTITVDNGVAQSGSISVTGVPTEANSSILINAAGPLIPDSGAPNSETLIDHDGDDIIIDDMVYGGSDPILDGDGLGFASGQYQDSVHYETLINLWGNSPGSYTLFVAEAQLDSNGNVIGDPQYVYNLSGGSIIFSPVPEPVTFAASAGLGAFGMCLLRRRLAGK